RKLYRSGDDSSTCRVGARRRAEVFVSLDGHETKFEHGSILVAFLPRIDQMEDSVVRPNAGVDLLVNTHSFGSAVTSFGVLRGLVELAILSERAGSIPFWLIHNLGILEAGSARLIMALVNQSGATVLEAIPIRRVPSYRH